MFLPEYEITNKLLLSVIEVETAAKVVDLIPSDAEWEQRIKKDTIARRAYQTLKFVGNELSLENILKIVKEEPGRDDRAADIAMRTGVVAKEKDIQEVLNWLNADRLVAQAVYIATKFRQGVHGERDLTQINTLLGERIFPASQLGIFRVSDKKGPVGLDLTGPLAVEVPYQIEDLYSWFSSADKQTIHPLIKAGIIFYELLRIAPFEENNFVSTIFFCEMTIAGEGFGFRQLIPYEEELLKSRELFQRSIDGVAEESERLTPWLEFFVKAIAEASTKTRIKLMNLVGERPIFRSEGGKVVALTERQITVMEEMTIRTEMSIKDIRAIVPSVSDDTILRDLKDLIDKKMIKKKGKTKGAVYILGKIKGFR